MCKKADTFDASYCFYDASIDRAGDELGEFPTFAQAREFILAELRKTQAQTQAKIDFFETADSYEQYTATKSDLRGKLRTLEHERRQQRRS